MFVSTALNDMSTAANPSTDSGITIGSHTLRSRLIVGTGKYATFEQMQECLEISGADVITVAVRRERLIDANQQKELNDGGRQWNKEDKWGDQNKGKGKGKGKTGKTC